MLNGASRKCDETMEIMRYDFHISNHDCVMSAAELETYLKQHGKYVIHNPDMGAFVFKCSQEEIAKYRQYEQRQVHVILGCDGADATLCGDCVDPENIYHMEFYCDRWSVNDDGRVEVFPYQLVFTLRDDAPTKNGYIQEEV